MKKGDANIWWIIIGAVIALIVLIIILIMFTGKSRGLEAGLSECEGKAGICVSIGSGCPQNTIKTSTFTCSTGNECCIGSPRECGPGQSECESGQCISYGQKSYCR